MEWTIDTCSSGTVCQEKHFFLSGEWDECAIHNRQNLLLNSIDYRFYVWVYFLHLYNMYILFETGFWWQLRLFVVFHSTITFFFVFIVRWFVCIYLSERTRVLFFLFMHVVFVIQMIFIFDDFWWFSMLHNISFGHPAPHKRIVCKSLFYSVVCLDVGYIHVPHRFFFACLAVLSAHASSMDIALMVMKFILFCIDIIQFLFVFLGFSPEIVNTVFIFCIFCLFSPNHFYCLFQWL